MKKPLTSALDIDPETWKKLLPKSNPFLQREFFLALEDSGSIGAKAGWSPLFLMDEQNAGLMYGFIKNHSYGEYIFDWEWARAYQQNGLAYYPKLNSMLPFTPVTTTPFIMPSFNKEVAQRLLEDFERIYLDHAFSSVHFLFVENDLINFFQDNGYFIRESIQYHFHNEDYKNFDDYLNALKTKKAKNVRQERNHPNLMIKKRTGDELQPEHARQMYKFYLSTIDHKRGIDYLKEEFFLKIFETMKKNVLYVEATSNSMPVAGSLFFYDETKLYGRYWGTNTHIDNLHFELCYYQGIEFCIDKKIKMFEAGAQGEHKIVRGFRPSRVFSAHKIKDPIFSDAIGKFISEERKFTAMSLDELSTQLPFKLS